MKKSAVVLVVFLLAGLSFAGCGSSGSSLEGVYKVQAGNTTAVLTLKTGNEATLSLIDDGSGIPVTYKVKDGTVVLIGADGKTTVGSFKIEDAGLRDETGNLFKKQ